MPIFLEDMEDDDDVDRSDSDSAEAEFEHAREFEEIEQFDTVGEDFGEEDEDDDEEEA